MNRSFSFLLAQLLRRKSILSANFQIWVLVLSVCLVWIVFGQTSLHQKYKHQSGIIRQIGKIVGETTVESQLKLSSDGRIVQERYLWLNDKKVQLNHLFRQLIEADAEKMGQSRSILLKKDLLTGSSYQLRNQLLNYIDFLRDLQLVEMDTPAVFSRPMMQPIGHLKEIHNDAIVSVASLELQLRSMTRKQLKIQLIVGGAIAFFWLAFGFGLLNRKVSFREKSHRISGAELMF